MVNVTDCADVDMGLFALELAAGGADDEEIAAAVESGFC